MLQRNYKRERVLLMAQAEQKAEVEHALASPRRFDRTAVAGSTVLSGKGEQRVLQMTLKRLHKQHNPEALIDRRVGSPAAHGAVLKIPKRYREAPADARTPCSSYRIDDDARRVLVTGMDGAARFAHHDVFYLERFLNAHPDVGRRHGYALDFSLCDIDPGVEAGVCLLVDKMGLTEVVLGMRTAALARMEGGVGVRRQARMVKEARDGAVLTRHRFEQFLQQKHAERTGLVEAEADARRGLTAAENRGFAGLLRRFATGRTAIVDAALRRDVAARHKQEQHTVIKEERVERRWQLLYEGTDFVHVFAVYHALQHKLLDAEETAAWDALLYLSKRSWGDGKHEELVRLRREKAQCLRLWDEQCEARELVWGVCATAFAAIGAEAEKDREHLGVLEDERLEISEMEGQARANMEDHEASALDIILAVAGSWMARLRADIDVLLTKLRKQEVQHRQLLEAEYRQLVPALSPLADLFRVSSDISKRLCQLGKNVTYLTSTPPVAQWSNTRTRMSPRGSISGRTQQYLSTMKQDTGQYLCGNLYLSWGVDSYFDSLMVQVVDEEAAVQRDAPHDLFAALQRKPAPARRRANTRKKSKRAGSYSRPTSECGSAQATPLLLPESPGSCGGGFAATPPLERSAGPEGFALDISGTSMLPGAVDDDGGPSPGTPRLGVEEGGQSILLSPASLECSLLLTTPEPRAAAARRTRSAAHTPRDAGGRSPRSATQYRDGKHVFVIDTLDAEEEVLETPVAVLHRQYLAHTWLPRLTVDVETCTIEIACGDAREGCGGNDASANMDERIWICDDEVECVDGMWIYEVPQSSVHRLDSVLHNIAYRCNAHPDSVPTSVQVPLRRMVKITVTCGFSMGRVGVGVVEKEVHLLPPRVVAAATVTKHEHHGEPAEVCRRLQWAWPDRPLGTAAQSTLAAPEDTGVMGELTVRVWMGRPVRGTHEGLVIRPSADFGFYDTGMIRYQTSMVGRLEYITATDHVQYSGTNRSAVAASDLWEKARRATAKRCSGMSDGGISLTLAASTGTTVATTRRAPRSRWGGDGITQIPQGPFHLCAVHFRGATVDLIQKTLQNIRFASADVYPTIGPRQVLIEVQDHMGSDFIDTTIDVIAPYRAPVLQCNRDSAHYTHIPKAIDAEHLCLLPPKQPTRLFSEVTITDRNTDQYMGGLLKVSIVGGMVPNDHLEVIIDNGITVKGDGTICHHNVPIGSKASDTAVKVRRVLARARGGAGARSALPSLGSIVKKKTETEKEATTAVRSSGARASVVSATATDGAPVARRQSDAASQPESPAVGSLGTPSEATVSPQPSFGGAEGDAPGAPSHLVSSADTKALSGVGGETPAMLSLDPTAEEDLHATHEKQSAAAARYQKWLAFFGLREDPGVQLQRKQSRSSPTTGARGRQRSIGQAGIAEAGSQEASFRPKIRAFIMRLCFLRWLQVRFAVKAIAIRLLPGVRIGSVIALLNSLAFQIKGTLEKEGGRMLQFDMRLGKGIVRRVDMSGGITRTMAREAPPFWQHHHSIAVHPPVLRAVVGSATSQFATPRARYKEGADPERCGLFDLGAGVEAWEYADTSAAICNPDEGDFLTLEQKEGIKLLPLPTPAPQPDVVSLLPAPGTWRRRTRRRSNAAVSPVAADDATGRIRQGVQLMVDAVALGDSDNDNDDDDDDSPRRYPLWHACLSRIMTRLREEVQKSFAGRDGIKALVQRQVTLQTCSLYCQQVTIGDRCVGVLEHTTRAVRIIFKKDVGKRDMGFVMRNIAFGNSSFEPADHTRVVRFAMVGPARMAGGAVVCVDVMPVDNVTAIILPRNTITYRPIRKEHEYDEPVYIAPLGAAFLEDPDTDWFDKGKLSVELRSGGSKHDALRLADLVQQDAMIQKSFNQSTGGIPKPHDHLRLRDPSQYRFTVDASTGTLALAATKEPFGIVTYPKSNRGLGGRNIVVSFAKIYKALGEKDPPLGIENEKEVEDKDDDPNVVRNGRVSIELVTYVLNSIIFSSVGYASKDTVSSVFVVAVSDGVNPQDGMKRLTIGMAGPLLTMPQASSASCPVGASVAPLKSMMLNSAAGTALDSGFFSVEIDEEESTGDGVLTFGRLDDVALKDGVLCQEQKGTTLAACAAFTPRHIRLEFGFNGRCVPRLMLSILRAVSLQGTVPGVVKVIASGTTAADFSRVIQCTTQVTVVGT